MAELVIMDARTLTTQVRTDTARAHHLIVEEGCLVAPDGGEHALVSIDDVDMARERAQRASERAYELLTAGVPKEPQRSALLTAAVSKIDVYGEVEAHVRTALVVRRALERFAPDDVVWITHRRALAASVASRVGISERVRFQDVLERPERWQGRSLAWLKRRQLDWTVRCLASLGTALRFRLGTPHAGPVLQVFDVRNAGMIRNVAVVGEGLEAEGVPTVGVYMDRRVGATALSLRPRTVHAPLWAFLRAGDLASAVARVGAVRGELRLLLDDAPSDEQAAERFAWRRFGRTYVTQTLVDLVASERLLDALDPAAVLVASDAHRYARMLVLLARERGLWTAVAQHGALGFEHFYVPVVADRMLAWGPWCRDWFVSRGEPRSRIQDVGFVRAPARVRLRPPREPGCLRLVFASQPIPDALTRALLDMVGAALEVDERLVLSVRPHPGESRRAALEAVVAAWPPGVRARTTLSPHGRSLEEDLAAADVCVVSQSTVGIDALVAGVPVVLLSHPAIRDRIPFAAFGAALEAADAPALTAALTVLRDRASVEALGARAASFLDAYVGRAGADAVRASATAIVTAISERAGERS